MKYTSLEIGNRCMEYRRDVLKVSQQVVATDLMLSVAMISRFERGLTDSLYIFTWYLSQGITTDYLLKGCD